MGVLLILTKTSMCGHLLLRKMRFSALRTCSKVQLITRIIYVVGMHNYPILRLARICLKVLSVQQQPTILLTVEELLMVPFAVIVLELIMAILLSVLPLLIEFQKLIYVLYGLVTGRPFFVCCIL